MKFYKKICASLIAFSLVFSFNLTAFAAESVNTVAKKSTAPVDILVAAGYTEDTAKALTDDERNKLAQMLIEDPTKVEIQTVVLKIDNLREIEAFYSYTDEELINADANAAAVKEARNNFDSLYAKSSSEIAQSLGISITEASMIQRAIEKGKKRAAESKNHVFEPKMGVTASGSLSSADLIYSQAVTDYSTSKAPSYDVSLAYCWKTVYALAIFNDAIAAAWGGSLNTKNINSNARYYDWGIFGWNAKIGDKTMTKTETPNTALVFEFPQGWTYNPSVNSAKTGLGSASFTIFQTQKMNLSSKIVSSYGHRSIAVTGFGIAPTAAPTLGFGSAWDTSPQLANNITY